MLLSLSSLFAWVAECISAAHIKKIMGSIPRWGHRVFSRWGLHALLLSVWVSSGWSGFLSIMKCCQIVIHDVNPNKNIIFNLFVSTGWTWSDNWTLTLDLNLCCLIDLLFAYNNGFILPIILLQSRSNVLQMLCRFVLSMRLDFDLYSAAGVSVSDWNSPFTTRTSFPDHTSMLPEIPPDIR